MARAHCCSTRSTSSAASRRAAAVRLGDRRPGGRAADPRSPRTADLDRAAAAGAVTARAHAGVVRLGVTRASSSRDATTDVKVGRSLCVSLAGFRAVVVLRCDQGGATTSRPARFHLQVLCPLRTLRAPGGPSPVGAVSDPLALCEIRPLKRLFARRCPALGSACPVHRMRGPVRPPVWSTCSRSPYCPSLRWRMGARVRRAGELLPRPRPNPCWAQHPRDKGSRRGSEPVHEHLGGGRACSCRSRGR